jgi:hypothetical protein
VILATTLSAALLGCQYTGSDPAADCDAPACKAARAPEFPAAWQGVWKGTCTATRPDGKHHAFAMELHVQPTAIPDRMHWVLVYGTGDRRQIREYELVTVDPLRGHFRIDEKNSIVIDAYLVDHTLHSHYAVEQALITVRYTLRDDTLLFELESADLSAVVESGGSDDVPAVKAYPTQVAQRATLVRHET